jgi:hypothetical protein
MEEEEVWLASSEVGRGVLNAPVEACCSFSNISCSSFGRRGGAGPGVQDERVVAEDVKARVERVRRMARRDWMVFCILVW